MEDKEFIDEEFDSEESAERTDTSAFGGKTLNISARRRLEEYRERREMERLLEDDFGMLEDIA